MPVKKKVAVIGCGQSGIAAIKILQEYGHDIVCYEKESSFGGMWNFSSDVKNIAVQSWHDELKYGTKATYSTLMINRWAIVSDCSDFPYEQGKMMLSHEGILDYLWEVHGSLWHSRIHPI